jgi:hypothetical protein
MEIADFLREYPNFTPLKEYLQQNPFITFDQQPVPESFAAQEVHAEVPCSRCETRKALRIKKKAITKAIKHKFSLLLHLRLEQK